jgi:GTP-binding protein
MYDEAVALVMKAPHTYTTEDVVELDCHGGITVLKRILDLIIKLGARPAEGGEFTKRAFLGGRIDMSQAEAVMDLINSKNDYAAKASLKKLQGGLKNIITDMREKLLYNIAYIESALDDPENYSLDEFPQELKSVVENLLITIDKLINSSGNGRLINEGIRTAIVGKPNAGKSSIVNAFIGEERHVVTDIAGTTRDSIYTKYDKFGFQFYLVDTAGIRKKNKVSEDLEFYSVMRAIRAIENSDVCILMLDATRGIEGQDLNIFSLIQRNQKGLVVVVNKWDLVEDKTEKVLKTFENAIRERLAPFSDFPIIFASAQTKQRIFKVLESAEQVYKNRQCRIPTARLNEEMLPLIEAYPPPSNKGKYIKIKYCTQLPNTQIPSFVFFANLPQYVKEPYRRFLENQIRQRWNLSGTPINIFIRQK